MGDLHSRLTDGRGEFLLFAVTPPRRGVSPERAQEIADATVDRLAAVDPDGLVVYDIDDESDRTAVERPFPFLPTLDPGEFLDRHLTAWGGPVVVYRAVGKYPEADLVRWLGRQDPGRVLSVFVGASSRDKEVATSLSRAQELRAEVASGLALGGVTIPERHTRRGDEHLRLLAKQAAGCSFFVTQVVYDLTAAKNLVSDYRYGCAARGIDPVPFTFTFTVVGSARTLEFLGWLGVEVPGWIRNEMTHSGDHLAASCAHAIEVARELIAFCRRIGAPFGLSVESVTNRRAEIDMSVELATRLRQELDR